ncbi:unnamed protein product, partial [Diamesa serratosioi]
MGNGMNKVLPGLFVGNYRDSKDLNQLQTHNITHILAIHDSPKHLYPQIHYLCVKANDHPDQNLSQYFSVCNDFIHGARLRKDCNVLVHCLAGMSRSVTITVVYIMCISDLNWQDALRVVRVGRKIANPNSGFLIQLQDFENNKVVEERRRMKERFPSLAIHQIDSDYIDRALVRFDAMISSRDLCEGLCKRNENCPTGVCRMNHDAKNTIGIFRRRPSSSPSSNGRLSVSPSSRSVSCPTSPRHSKHNHASASISTTNLNDVLISGSANIAGHSSRLYRSPSSISQTASRPQNTMQNYTSSPSAPASAHCSRVDLSNIGPARATGSVIYLGRTNSSNSGSRLSLVSRSNSSSP